jgi:predicted RNA binding protein YcfA (HicA-like mRNA interferase family)
MKYSNDKQIAAMVRSLIAAGWQYQTGGRHARLTSPSGRRIAVPGTPSDHRAFQNFKCHIRKISNERRA